MPMPMVICVYEGNNEMTDEFIEQLAIVDDVIAANQDCHIVVGGISMSILLEIGFILPF